jgi:ABC-2 type transport system ATP-binding protein
VAEATVIEIADLRKSYGDMEAVRGLSLRVSAGSIYGFLGRNGAGKTTTIKVLLGMTRPTAGDVRVFGMPAATSASSVAIRRRTGFVSEDKDLYDFMTVEEMIRFTAPCFPTWRKDLEERYLHKFELRPAQHVKSLSRGMRTKLALLLALSRGAEQMTVFFSSHQIAEVDQIADHVAIIDRGRAVLAGALDDLRERYRRVQLVFDGDAPEPAFRSPGVERVRRRGRVLTLLSSAGTDQVVNEARALHPVSIDVTPVSLKDIFLETVVAED